MVKFPITKKGLELLEKEIRHLKHVERPAIIEAISTARDFGDLSENAEYHAAREKQSFVEGRILDLEDKLSRAEIIDISKLSKESIKFGATVKLVDDDTEEEVTYVIVGERHSGIICMNGAAAHLIKQGEEIIIMGFKLSEKPIKAKNILVDKKNSFVKFMD